MTDPTSLDVSRRRLPSWTGTVLPYLPALGCIATAVLLHSVWPHAVGGGDRALSVLLILIPLPIALYLAVRIWVRRVNDQMRYLADISDQARRLQQLQSEQLQAEIALHERDRQFLAVFHSALDAMLLVDDNRCMVDANTAACTLFGVSRDGVLLTPIDRFLTPASSREIADQWQKILSSGEDQGELVVAAGGDEHVVEFSFKASVVPGRHLFIWRDVSERKRLEAELRQSQKLETVGRLAGGVAHDFNNLLTVILGNAGLALERSEGTTKEAVIEIIGAAERAGNLTRQLLAFSRKQVLKTSVVNLNTVLSDIEKMLRRLLDESIELHTVLDPSPWAVKVDTTQVEQVIVNLVVNARDAMPAGGRLVLETANVEIGPRTFGAHASESVDIAHGSYVRLTVSDTGVGMDDATRSHIFEPFFTTKEQDKGTGLGLATVYGIVRQSGGYLLVDSAPGRGSTFSIFFPRVEQTVAQRTDRDDAMAPLRGAETILLVEDEEAVRTLASHVLRRYGYTVLTAECGETACQIAADQHFDLLVTDVVMPRMNGKELAVALRARSEQLKVVFISGYTGEAVSLQTAMPDAVFLPKPFTSVGLARTVRDLLDLERPERAPQPASAGR